MKFRFVDAITKVVPGRTIEGVKAVSLEEYFLLRPAGLKMDFPPTLLAESLFQLANFLIHASFPGRLGLIVLFERIEWPGSVQAGDVVRLTVDLASRIDEACVLEGRGSVNGRTVVEGRRCTAKLVDASTLVDPDQYDRMFRRLSGAGLAGGKGAA